jgi:hypothetical protein
MENVQLQPLLENITIKEIDEFDEVNTGYKKRKNSKNHFKNLMFFLKPSEVKQYLFKVTNNNLIKESKPFTIGKLDISWRNSFGEFGHLQTHPLSQPVIKIFH